MISLASLRAILWTLKWREVDQRAMGSVAALEVVLKPVQV